MMRLEILLIFLIVPIITSSIELSSKPDQIIEVFRHGARGPFIGFDKSWEKSQKGKLTLAGMKQHYELGKSLFNDYPHLFDASQGTDRLYILANAHSRCFQSAFFQRAGLYSKTLTSLYKESGSKALSFQDLLAKKASFLEIEDHFKTSNGIEWSQIQEVNENNAKLFQRAQGSVCPNGRKWEKENHNDSKAREAWEIFRDTIESVRENIPRTIRFKNSFDLNIIGDAMMVNMYHNKSLLPLGIINEEVARNMTFAYSWFVFHNEYGREVQRQLAAYSIVDEILENLEAFRRGDENHKRAALYSGHDYNILAILGAFGVISEDCIMANFQSTISGSEETLPYPNCYFPYFASNLIFEFYNQTENEEAYVRLLYNNKPVPLCGGQDDFCRYEEFVAFAKDSVGNLTPETYETVCTSSDDVEEEIEDLESKPDEVFEERDQKKSTIGLLVAGSLEDTKAPSSQVILRLNERMRVNQNSDNSPIWIIVLGWVVLSALICFAIKSRTKSFRLHSNLKKNLKKKTSFEAADDIEVKIH